MIQITTFTVHSLPRFAADGCAILTKPDSLNRKWFSGLAEGKKCDDLPLETIYAVAFRADDFEMEVIGWGTMNLWQNEPSMQGFVHPDWRGKHLATAMSAVLACSNGVSRDAVGVFSPEFVTIANRLGFQTVKLYKRVDDGWVVSCPT
jgi:hypothetical protein